MESNLELFFSNNTIRPSTLKRIKIEEISFKRYLYNNFLNNSSINETNIKRQTNDTYYLEYKLIKNIYSYCY